MLLEFQSSAFDRSAISPQEPDWAMIAVARATRFEQIAAIVSRA